MEIKNTCRIQLSKNSIFASERGFAFVILLSLMPLVMAAFIALSLHSYLLQFKMKTQTDCRKSLIQAQYVAAQGLRQLFLLNTQAESLRKQYQQAEMLFWAAVASKNAPAAAQARRMMDAIRAQQQILDKIQKALIKKEEMLLAMAELRVWTKLQSQLSKAKTEYAQVSDVYLYPPRGWRKLPVRPDRPGTPAPLYELEADFSAKQAVSASWKYSYVYGGKNWSKDWFYHKSRHSEQCQVSLRGEALKLEPYVSEAKFF